MGDLVYLVSYLFRGGPEPPCYEEGDFDGTNSIDVGDITACVAYIFMGGTGPAPCL